MVKIDRQPVLLLAIPCATYVLEQALSGEKPLGKEKNNRNYGVKTVGWMQKAELVLW